MISGIYQIKNIQTNDIYIGSSVNLTERFSCHKRNLKRNTHHCHKLQNAWNKYGEERFVFEIIEKIEEKTKLIETEQMWMDKLNPKYNECPIAKSVLGIKRKPFTNEHLQKLRLAKLGKKLTAEHVDKIQKTRNGYKHSIDTIEKIRKSNQNQKRSLSTREKMSESKKGEKSMWFGTTGPMGGKHHSVETKIKKSKLNEKQVLEVLRLSKEEHFSGIKISKLYSVSHSTIDKILSGKTWAHLTKEE